MTPWGAGGGEQAAKLSRSEKMVDSPELTAFQQIQAEQRSSEVLVMGAIDDG